jgi:hypothetical protein
VRKIRAPDGDTNVTSWPTAYGTPSWVPGPSTIAGGPSLSPDARASRRATGRVGVADQSCQSVVLPPIRVNQNVRAPVTATLGMPKPPLGPSSQPRIVREPNVQRARVALFQSATEPQFALVRPTE